MTANQSAVNQSAKAEANPAWNMADALPASLAYVTESAEEFAARVAKLASDCEPIVATAMEKCKGAEPMHALNALRAAQQALLAIRQTVEKMDGKGDRPSFPSGAKGTAGFESRKAILNRFARLVHPIEAACKVLVAKVHEIEPPAIVRSKFRVTKTGNITAEALHRTAIKFSRKTFASGAI